MENPKKAYNIRVTGRVQRIGYRRFILETAQELEITGYVQNLKDGSVKIFAQGKATTINQFIKRIKTPPKNAIIKSFETKQTPINPKAKYFEIKFGSIAEELQEGFGSMEKEFKDYRRDFKNYRNEFGGFQEEFRDYREEFRDYRNEFGGFQEEFRDYREEFRDYRNEFGGFQEEFRDYREEFRDYQRGFGAFAEKTDQNFQRLDEKYGEISGRLTEILETLRKESTETRKELKRSVDALTKLVNKFIGKQGVPQ